MVLPTRPPAERTTADTTRSRLRSGRDLEVEKSWKKPTAKQPEKN
jgi:hypothetical protein